MTPHAARLPPGRESTVSIRVVHELAYAAEQAGVARSKLLRSAKLDCAQLDAVDARVPRGEVYRLCELAIALTGDPAFGLHWAQRLDGSAFAPISQLIAHGATLRQAFESLARFQSLLSDDFGYRLLERGDEVTVRCLSLPGESPITQRFVAEMIVMGLFRLVRFYNPRARVERVSFAYPAPAYHDAYTRAFERAARFDAPFTGLAFQRALMDTCFRHIDEDLHDALRSVVERRFLRLTQQAPYALRVRDFLLQHGAPCRCDMTTVASALGIGPRSLRRRLCAEGHAYAAIQSEACAIAAKQLLLDTQRTIQETAYELGFSDPTAFHRAFKRWTGMTPSAFRQCQPASAALAATTARRS